MKYLFWILLLFGAAVALATASHNPAYVLLVYPPYRIELSLTLFAVLYILTFGFGYGLIRLTIAAIHLPSYVRTFRLERAQNKARRLLNDALSAFFEGRYAAAEKASSQAIEMGDTSALHPIIAARASHELREFDKRDAYLADAKSKTVGENTMRLIAKTEFQLSQKQPQSALNSLKELSDSGIHKHVGALGLELKAQLQVRNWDAVLEVITQLEKRKSIDMITADQLRQQAWVEKLRGQIQDVAALRALWKSIPVEFRHRSKIAAAAAKAFGKLGDCQSALHLLSDNLNAQWDSELVALYGDCQAGDVVAQIEQAEKWLSLHKQDAGLLLALGKLCLHQKLWGKAQNYLEASLSLEPGYAAYTALGQLAEKMGKHEQALDHFQKALQYR
ncbi:MAG TPA: heme biosynthesis HemY N-terminal domain-containing protein [Gallionella sp.]|nr:heme biosynthesis HemY N-terminal domain-containing protein [Gallionella sp.]